MPDQTEAGQAGRAATTASPPDFITEPVPGEPGWFTWNLTDTPRFNAQVMGPLKVHRETTPGGVDVVRLRMMPERRHSNLLDMVHGAITLALADIALFSAIRLLLDGDAAGSVTLDLSTQFLGAGRLDQPLDAVTEVLSETRRLVLLRGLIEQGDARVAAFAGTVRKPSGR